MRRERDRIGAINVPASKYWGAGTQRVLDALPASADRIPDRFYAAYGYVKRAAAIVNAQAGRLPVWKSEAIVQAADELIAGRLAEQFPLSIWQSGSGRDADTNVNEVLANRATQLAGRRIGSRGFVDPVHEVNLGQDLSHACTTTMQIATVIEIEDMFLPRANLLLLALDRNRSAFGLHATRLQSALGRIDEAEGGLHEIALNERMPEGQVAGDPTPAKRTMGRRVRNGASLDGDAASGTPDSGAADPAAVMTADDLQIMVGVIAADTARPFTPSPPGTAAGSTVDALVAAMGALRGLAVMLPDIVSELSMPGGEDRLRPLPLVDVITIICLQVLGQDQLVTAAASHCYPGPSRMRPLIISAVLHSIQSLGTACEAVGRMLSRAR